MTRNSFLYSNVAFAVIAVLTGLILVVPLVAMQITEEVNWNVFDFVLMGSLLFGTGAFTVVVSRVYPRYWLLIALISSLVLLYTWVELAVGIFFSVGS